MITIPSGPPHSAANPSPGGLGGKFPYSKHHVNDYVSDTETLVTKLWLCRRWAMRGGGREIRKKRVAEQIPTIIRYDADSGHASYPLD